MKTMLYHVTGSLQGRSQYFDADRISFGIGEQCSVVFDPRKDPIVSPVHAELYVEKHVPIIRDRSEQNALFVNGQQTLETGLQDGDLLQFGERGPLVRFHVLPDKAPGVKPWRYIVSDSRDMVVHTPHRRYTSPLYLGRAILKDAFHYGSPTVRIVAAIVILAPLVIIAALGIGLYQQFQAAAVSEERIAELLGELETGRLSREELERRIVRERQTIEELRREQEELKERLEASVKKEEAARRSEEEVRAMRRQLDELAASQRFAEEIISRFRKGVGLLQTGYALRETASARALRYQGFDEEGYPLLGENGNPLLTLEGDTPEMVIFSAGTGFLIDKQGTILTNRHVVQMWEVYEPVQETLRAGFEPDPRVLRIFFPGSPDPYPVEVLAVSDRVDLAILRTTRPPTGVTPLKLAPPEKSVHVGEPVIVMSYPGTFDSILSRLPSATSDELLREVGSDPIQLPERLSRRGLVRPLTTHGHVSDVSGEVMTYEARSAGGSSGGPVLDRAGHVIAVNHSMLRQIGGVNLGLPVRVVREHLVQLDVARK